MKLLVSTIVLLSVLPFAGWPRQAAVDASTPEGQALTAISKESDAARKLSLIQQFVKSYPASTQAPWAWEQLQTAYMQAKEYDKAIDAGEKALAGDPASTDAAYSNLKAAEAKADPDAVVKWAQETSRLGRQAARAAAAAPPGDVDAKSRADYAQQLATYAEYSIYATALKATDPAKIVALNEALEKGNPQSPYLNQLAGRYLGALQQMGQKDKAAAEAEAIVKRDPGNEDALLMAADYNLQHENTAKSLDYSTKLVTSLESKAKPEGVSDEDWAKQKNKVLGLAYWIQGISLENTQKYQEEDKSLRKALPLIQGNSQAVAVALFHLGVADYELGKGSKTSAMMRDALKFSQQSAAMASPVQEAARANVIAIQKGTPTRRSRRR